MGTTKKLFNILFLFNIISDSKEKKLVAGFNLCIIVDKIVSCSFDCRQCIIL